jgi:hypothetical protein
MLSPPSPPSPVLSPPPPPSRRRSEKLAVCQRKCAGDGCIFELDACYADSWAEHDDPLCDTGPGNHQNPCFERRFWHCVRRMAVCPGDDPASVRGVCERRCEHDSCIFDFDACYNDATNDPSICPFGPGNHQNPCYEEHFWRCLVQIASCEHSGEQRSILEPPTAMAPQHAALTSPLLLVLLLLGPAVVLARLAGVQQKVRLALL